MSDRTPNITYQEVAGAIETLAIEGAPATTTNIRRTLAINYPGTELRGSPNKVLPLAKQYFESNSYDIVFRDTHLSTELIGAMVAETKRHMSLFQEQHNMRLEAAEADRDQLLHESMALADERDELLKDIPTAEKEHAEEIKQLEVELGKLAERASRWESDCRETKVELGKSKSLLEEKIGQLAVADEKSKPTDDLKERLDIAEQRNAEHFAEIQQLNRELREVIIERAKLEKQLLSIKGTQKTVEKKS
jgi:hypothetical protein